MHNYDRDFIVSTLSVIQEHRRNLVNTLGGMDLRLDELENMLYSFMDEDSADQRDRYMEEAFLQGRWSMEAEYENDKIIYDSARKPKQCMCDDCWDVPADKYEHRMD